MQQVKQALGFKTKPQLKKVIYYPISKLNSETKTQLKAKLDLLNKKSKNVDALLVGVDVGPASGRAKESQLT